MNVLDTISKFVRNTSLCASALWKGREAHRGIEKETADGRSETDQRGTAGAHAERISGVF